MPRLIVMRGTHHQFHDLVGSKSSIGAHADNDIVVEGDAGISRWHCVIQQEKGAYVLLDNKSRTGTFLNGSRVERAELTVGDRLRTGQTVLLFVSTGSQQKDEKAARRLGNLLILQEVSKVLNTETDLDALLELIMDTAIHLTGAERGFLVQLKGNGKQLEFPVARNIDAEVVRSPEFKISNSVIRKVVKTGEPILTSNAQFDLRDFKSIAAQEVRTVLCVPLRVKSTTYGALYLDSRGLDSAVDEEAENLLYAFADQAAIAIENARLLQEQREKEAILSELRVASRIQLALLPRSDPDVQNVEVSGTMLTAQEVGGDYYDYIWGPVRRDGTRNLYVAIGDVSGKGVPAGLVMVMARSILRSLVARGARPADVLREANRLLKQDLKPGMFMSMLLMTLDPGTGRLLMAGCGHERPLLFRARDRRVERIDLGGLVLGVVADLAPHLSEREVRLEPGDQLLFYTDGVTEAVDPARHPFGLERLEEILRATGHEPPQRVLQTLLDALALHAAGAAQHDDITLIAMRRTG